MDYTEAKLLKSDAEQRELDARRALDGWPRLPNGLPTEATRLSPAYRAAKSLHGVQYAKLQVINQWFMRTYKREYQIERRTRA